MIRYDTGSTSIQCGSLTYSFPCGVRSRLALSRVAVVVALRTTVPLKMKNSTNPQTSNANVTFYLGSLKSQTLKGDAILAGIRA